MSGITDPAEEYFKNGLWAWVSSQWKKLVADASSFLRINISAQDIDVEIAQTTAADLTPGVCGWDGSQWQKLPMLWGFSDQYVENSSANNVPAGDVTLAFSAVPAGEIWIITHFSTYPHQANAAKLYMSVVSSIGNTHVKVTGTITAYETIEAACPLLLEEGDCLRILWKAAFANDDFRSWAVGYKMKVGE